MSVNQAVHLAVRADAQGSKDQAVHLTVRADAQGIRDVCMTRRGPFSTTCGTHQIHLIALKHYSII